MKIFQKIQAISSVPGSVQMTQVRWRVGVDNVTSVVYEHSSLPEMMTIKQETWYLLKSTTQFNDSAGILIAQDILSKQESITQAHIEVPLPLHKKFCIISIHKVQ